MRRVVIFDLDQTLIVSAGIYPAWMQALTEAGLTQAEAHAAFLYGIGRPTEATPESTARFSPQQVKQIVARYQQLLGDGDPMPLPGAEQALAGLRAEGEQIFLSTGSSAALLTKILDRLKWNGYFDLALGSDAACPKGPAHYRRMVAQSGRAEKDFYDNAFVVGDGVADMLVAKQMGARYRVALLAPTTTQATRDQLIAAGANLIITHLDQLAEVVHAANPLQTRYAVNSREVA
jgi:phosphoglycolate phosphatase-like HAD superfamily hydrolase